METKERFETLVESETRQPRAKRHVMRIMGTPGDTRQTWDPARPDEVAAAKKVYDELKEKRYAAFRVDKESGNRGEQMREFDPNAAMMILVPPMAGG